MQFLFELIYLVVCTLPVIFRAKSLKSLNHDSAIPCSVKYCHMAGLWKSCPESPQEMSCLFMRFRTCNRIYHITSGIKCLRYPLDISALSSRIPALVSDDDRNLLLVKFVVQSAELLLQLVEFLLVLLIRKRLVERHFWKLWNLLECKCILQYRRGVSLIEQSRLYALIDNIKDLQLSPLPLLCIYHVPRSIWQIGVIHEAVKRVKILIIFLVLLQIMLWHSPLCRVIFQKCLKSLLLLMLIDMEEELHNEVAVIRKASLKSLGAVHPFPIFLIRQLPGHPASHDIPHPATVQEYKFSLLRYSCKILVQEWSSLLIIRGIFHRLNLEKSWIHILDDPSNKTSLTCGTPALKYNKYRDLAFLDLDLIACQIFSGDL